MLLFQNLIQTKHWTELLWMFFQGIFDGECRVVHPRESACAPSVVIPIYPPRDVPVDLHIKAFVGYKGNGWNSHNVISKWMKNHLVFREQELSRFWADSPTTKVLDVLSGGLKGKLFFYTNLVAISCFGIDSDDKKGHRQICIRLLITLTHPVNWAAGHEST